MTSAAKISLRLNSAGALLALLPVSLLLASR